ncbi:uncharacterized protein M6B38_392920 [Iris pallida]|uniref:Uncharacterized protein n=1 Tax=Iris pallida TaxID=29817 RepID=A0AAX6FYR9_IRIPA|nr:uncharacterized protein M6B38_392920 [Iris pallida]
MEKDRKVRSDCVNASNPFHVCAEYCSGGGHKPSSQARPGGGRSPAVQNGEKTNGGGERRHVDPTCPNASNPFHQCSDYCKGKTPGAAKKRTEVGRAVVAAYNGERSKEVGEGRHVDPSCVNASNPFHQCGEYCAQKTNRGGKAAPNGEVSKVEGTKLEGSNVDRESKLEGNNVDKERNVDPQCLNTSDPSNQHAEYGSGRSTGRTSLTKTNALGTLLAAESAEESKERLSFRADGKADPSCKNASNPFHVCAEYCSQRSNDTGRVDKGKSVIANGSRSPKHAVQRRAVDPRCVNAANPFHVCAEYCFERIREEYS